MDAINLQGVWPNMADAGVVIPPAPPATRHGAYNPNAWKLLHGIKDAEVRGDLTLPVIGRRGAGRIKIKATVSGRPEIEVVQGGRASMQVQAVSRGRADLEISVKRQSITALLSVSSSEFVLDHQVRGQASLFQAAPQSETGESDPEGAMLVGLEGDLE